MSTARNVALKAVADGAASASALVVFPLMAHHVGAGGYGAYGQMTNLAIFLVPFASLGIGAAIVRYFAGGAFTDARRRSLIRVLLTTTVVSGLVGAAVALGAEGLNRLVLDWPDGGALFRCGGALVTLGAIELTLLNFVQARNEIALQAVYQLASTILSLVVLVLVLMAGGGVIAVAGWFVILKLITTVGLLVCVLKRRTATGDDHFEPAQLRTMIRYGMPLSIAGLGLWLVHVSDRFLIGRYMTPSAVGRYAAAYAIVGLTASVATPLFVPALPRLMAAAVSGDRAALHADIRMFHRYITLAMIVTGVGLVVFAQPLVAILGGDDFHVHRAVILLLVPGLTLVQWNGLSNYVLIAHDRTLFVQNAWLVAGAVNFIGNLVAVPHFGIEGAAAMTCAAFMVFAAMNYWAAQRAVPLARLYAWRTTVNSLLAGAIAAIPAALVLAHTSDDVAPVLGAGVVFGLLYLAALFGLRELGGDDVAVVRSVFRRTGPPAPTTSEHLLP